MNMNEECQKLLLHYMYKDILTVYRLEKVIADDFSDDYAGKPSTIYKEIPCKLAKYQRGRISEEKTARTTEYNIDLQVNLEPDKDIQENDILEVEHNGQIFRLRAGVAFKYPTHQEVSARDMKEVGGNVRD